MANPFDQFDAAPARQPTLKERDIEAGIDQSGASAASSVANATRSNTLLPSDAEKAAADARKAKADASAAEVAAEAARVKAAREKAAGGPAMSSDEMAAAAKRANLNALTQQINRVQGLFNSGQRDNAIPILGSLMEYLPTDENQAFDAASAGLAEQGGAAFRVAGMGAQSDTELKQFTEANKPSSWSTDSKNTERLAQLRRRVDATRAELGLPAAKWEGLEDGAATFDEQGNPVDDKYEGGTYDKDGKYLGLQTRVTDDSGSSPPSDTPPSGSGDGGSGMGMADLAAGRKPRPAPTYSMASFLKGIGQGAGDLVEAVGDIPGLVVNPINTMIGRAAGYDNYTSDIGSTLRETIGLPDNPNQLTSAINKGGFGALTGSSLARAASGLAAPGAIRGALAQFGATPGRDLVAGAGAGAGGELGQRVGGTPGRVVGTLGGGLAGYGGGGALSRAVASERKPNALMQAADDLNVTMMPADVGGVGTRMASGATGSTFGNIPMVEGARRAVISAAAARHKIASDIGGVATDNLGAGLAVKRGFSQFEKSSGKRAGELYDQISVPKETTASADKTREALHEITQGFDSNPALSQIWTGHPVLRRTLETLTPNNTSARANVEAGIAKTRLADLEIKLQAQTNGIANPQEVARLQRDITDTKAFIDAQKPLSMTPPGGTISWEDMKRLRSIVGEKIGQPGIASDGSDVAAMRKFYSALSSDMEATAAATSPRALTQFNRANQYWRGRESRIEDVFSSLLGPDGNRSPENVFNQINSWAKGERGDFGRVARTIRSMPEDEANTVRSTIVGRMGMARPANQDATGEVFSPAKFSTEWRGMSSRAKNVLFPNKQHREDLDKLALVTDGMKHADDYQNYSKTALSVNTAGQGTLAIASLPAAAALAALQFGAGKLLASPRFARIIASSAKLPAEQAGRRIQDQLSVLATREPLIANDVKAVQQYLIAQVEKSPGRAAADDTSDRRRPPPKK